jgi:hypothetical protein
MLKSRREAAKDWTEAKQLWGEGVYILKIGNQRFGG